MKQDDFPSAEIHETKKIQYNNPIIFAGFVGAGLVGTRSVNHIINELKMKEVGFMRSKHLPPSTVFMQGGLRHPFRFYANDDGSICAIICEIIISLEGLYSIASSILEWAEKKGSNEIVVLDGIASSKHDNKTFCAAEADLCRIMENNGIEMIPQGFITGISGGILNECLVREIRGVTLLVRANEKSPDPLAANTLLNSMIKAYGMKIDAKELKNQQKQIGKDFKELSEKYTEHKKIDSSMYM